MTDELIEQWAQVIYGGDCSYQLALVNGFSGNDLTAEHFCRLMTFMRDNSPSALGFESVVGGLQFDE